MAHNSQFRRDRRGWRAASRDIRRGRRLGPHTTSSAVEKETPSFFADKIPAIDILQSGLSPMVATAIDE